MWGVYHKALEKERAIENCVNFFDRYKELADGDLNTAIKFFQKTFKEENEEVKELSLKRIGIEFPINIDNMENENADTNNPDE